MELNTDSNKQEPEKDEDESLDKMDVAILAKKTRSKMNHKEIVNWLRSRRSNFTRKKYLYYPEELLRQIEIRNIFRTFDKDGSKSLDMDEFQQMFQKYKIMIKEKDLEDLYDIVDDDKDKKLNPKEFKKCALNDKANEIFTNIMRRLRKEDELLDKNSRLTYLPMSFENSMSFLSYLITRDDIMESITTDPGNKGIREKIKNIQELFKISSIYYSQKKNSKKRETVQGLSVKEMLNNNDSQVSNPSQFIAKPKNQEPKLANTKSTISNIDRTDSNEEQLKSPPLWQKKAPLSAEMKSFSKNLEIYVHKRKKRAMDELDQEIKSSTTKTFQKHSSGNTELDRLLSRGLISRDLNVNGHSHRKFLAKTSYQQTRRHASSLSDFLQTRTKTSEAIFRPRNTHASSQDFEPMGSQDIKKHQEPSPNSFFISKDLREVDNIISENVRQTASRFVDWEVLDSHTTKGAIMRKGQFDDLKKMNKLKGEIKELNEIARNKYGVEIDRNPVEGQADQTQGNPLMNLNSFQMNFQKIKSKNTSLENNKLKQMLGQAPAPIGPRKSLRELKKYSLSQSQLENTSIPKSILFKALEETSTVLDIHPEFRYTPNGSEFSKTMGKFTTYSTRSLASRAGKTTVPSSAKNDNSLNLFRPNEFMRNNTPPAFPFSFKVRRKLEEV